MKTFLSSCAEDVVRAQEHNLHAKKINRATRCCPKNCWQFFLGAADVTSAEHGTSGGTTIYVRNGIGTYAAKGLIAPDA